MQPTISPRTTLRARVGTTDSCAGKNRYTMNHVPQPRISNIMQALNMLFSICYLKHCIILEQCWNSCMTLFILQDPSGIDVTVFFLYSVTYVYNN